MATGLLLYKKSTLPSILDSYLPAHCKHQQKIETDNKGMRNNKQDLSDKEKDECIKQALQEQRHLETYKNMYRLRNILCERYRALLNEKVQKQRIQIKMSDLRFRQHAKQKEKKNIPSHTAPFCKLSHNAKYLESIPQSSSYLVIGLQNELTKLGILKNQQDYEDFWKLIRNSSKLKETLPDIKAKMFATKSLPLSASARTNPPAQPLSGLINSSGLKTSKTSLLQSADTYQVPTCHLNKQIKTQQQTVQTFSKGAIQMNLHHWCNRWCNCIGCRKDAVKCICGTRRVSGCSKHALQHLCDTLRSYTSSYTSGLLLSWLSEVQKKHGEQSRTQQVNKTCKSNRKYEQHLHYLHHMYYFSLVNMASSKRLLEQNGQFSDVRKESCAHDLVDYLFPNCHKQSGVNCNKMRMGENTFPSLVDRKHQEMHHKDPSNILKVSKEKRKMLRHQKDEITEDQKCKISNFAKHEMIAVPLTLEDVALFCPVVEAKPSGTYWTNYADKDSIISDENIN